MTNFYIIEKIVKNQVKITKVVIVKMFEEKCLRCKQDSILNLHELQLLATACRIRAKNTIKIILYVLVLIYPMGLTIRPDIPQIKEMLANNCFCPMITSRLMRFTNFRTSLWHSQKPSSPITAFASSPSERSLHCSCSVTAYCTYFGITP